MKLSNTFLALCAFALCLSGCVSVCVDLPRKKGDKPKVRVDDLPDIPKPEYPNSSLFPDLPSWK